LEWITVDGVGDYPTPHKASAAIHIPVTVSIAIVATPWLVCDIADQRAGYAADSRTNGCTSDIARSNTTYDGTTRSTDAGATFCRRACGQSQRRQQRNDDFMH
jgi:hypothetical protein